MRLPSLVRLDWGDGLIGSAAVEMMQQADVVRGEVRAERWCQWELTAGSKRLWCEVAVRALWAERGPSEFVHFAQ